MSDREKESKIYRLVILPGVPFSIITKLAKELHLNLVEEEVYTNLPGEETPIKTKVLAFESTNRATLEKAKQLLVANLDQRIKDISTRYES
ncbi:MAG: hypothetical protein L6N95_00775 [Candidatus Methylarchaceae archaeon HK01B]|nr:hypothetical protein [Candidatus Methylarchaceae archaeon HK01M]MCP8311400.1 hypothetical protein [Candidatus Methylarchaceae archaeon HK02M1]MCP8318346.1 hypothetical protein [Candidatus Methylarchaceae archaeon HK01B]